MPKLYVAYQKDGESQRFASGSMTLLKNRIKEHLETEWTVVTYTFKPDVPTLCKIVEDISDLEADEAEDVRINASGQVRKVGK